MEVGQLVVGVQQGRIVLHQRVVQGEVGGPEVGRGRLLCRRMVMAVVVRTVRGMVMGMVAGQVVS